MKGVSEEFKLMTDMEKLLLEGSFNLREDVVDYTTLGSGLAMTLGARPGLSIRLKYMHPSVSKGKPG
jgi:ABC-type lipoprotein release transport system permease subunit